MREDIAKQITHERCAQVADAANRAFRAMQLDTVEAVSLFLAHAAVESEAMTSMGARGDDPKVVGKFKGRGPLQLTMDQNYMKTLGVLDERAKQLQGRIAKETDQAKKKKLEQDLAMVSKASRCAGRCSIVLRARETQGDTRLPPASGTCASVVPLRGRPAARSKPRPDRHLPCSRRLDAHVLVLHISHLEIAIGDHPA